MNDRELLKYAAKAAGFVIDEYPRNERDGARVYRSGDVPNVVGQRLLFKWNPRNDDGDALRLAGKLGIWVEPSHDQMTVTAFSIHNEGSFTELSGGNIYDSTRQVILRAAGVIGKLMESKQMTRAIDGGAGRDITIHPPKDEELKSQTRLCKKCKN